MVYVQSLWRGSRLVAALVALMLVLTACGGKGKQAAPADSGSAGGSAPAGVGPEQPAPSGPFGVGDTAILGSIQVTLKQVEAIPSTLGEGRYFLLAELDVLNTGDKSTGISALGWFKLKAPDGRTVSVSVYGTRQAPSGIDGTLWPNQPHNGWVAFELPGGEGEYSLQVKPPGDVGTALYNFAWPGG